MNKMIAFLALFLSFHLAHASKKITYIGDSQSFAARGLGYLMSDFLEHYPESCQGITRTEINSLDFHAVEGSSYHTWVGKGGGWICKRKERLKFKGPIRDQVRRVSCQADHNKVAEILKKKPELFVFQLHGNSQHRPAESIKNDVEKFLEELPDKAACVLITSPPYRVPSEKNKLRQKVQEIIVDALQTSAKGRNCKVIRGFTQQTLKRIARNKTHYADPMHISAAGAKVFFNEFVRPEFCKFPLFNKSESSEKVIRSGS